MHKVQELPYITSDYDIHLAAIHKHGWSQIRELKGKFSSRIEGALASTLNHDFNWKQLSEMILCIFLLSKIDSETAEI